MSFFATLLFALLTFKAQAHPVAFQDAVGVMTWNQSFMSDNWVTYSFRPDMAIAARMMRFDAPEGRTYFYAPQFDYLIKRWNKPDYQGNIYAFGAYGSQSFQGDVHGAGLGGVEMDAESRKYFGSIKYEKMWGDLGPDFYHVEARLGLAPYEAEYNEIASWFMVQYQYHPSLDKKNVITPLARLFYKSFLIEIGSSFDGDLMTNFMFHF
jgi:hypothetical protein